MTDTSQMIDTAAADRPLAELTLRGVILGGIITLLFTAANVYLGLKVGLTFATSIPAAVISMAVLRYFADSSILENNIVQTIASAAGTLAAIIFVLPGLVMVGWWQGFPYLETAAITGLGGILGVMFSVPLRRALVIDSDLPYPEGRAAAEVLQVGAASREGGAESAAGLAVLVRGSLVSAGFAVLTQTKVFAAEAALWFRAGAGATGIAGGLSFALFGVGHLVGLSVGIAQLVGLVTGWWILLPILTAQQPLGGEVEVWANTIFRQDVRFFGAGVIGVAAVWTLLKIAGPVVGGIRSALAASKARGRGETLALTERDLPIGIVAGGSLLVLVPIAWLVWSVIANGPLAGSAFVLIAGALLFVVVIGLLVAAVTGYMAGLIGASNSPVSGIGILAVLAAALMLVGLFGRDNPPGTTQALVAFALIVTGIVFGVADDLQRQSARPEDRAIGRRDPVETAGRVDHRRGVRGADGAAGARSAQHRIRVRRRTGSGAERAGGPQAGLISSLAKGVLGGDLNWTMIGWGAVAGMIFIALDETLGALKRLRLPPLAVGIGIYLPMAVILPVVIGAVIGHWYEAWADRARNPEFARRMGVLLATGMIVGESLFGVAFAGIVAASGSDAPLALVGTGFVPTALIVGTLAFLAATWWLYRDAQRRVATTA